MKGLFKGVLTLVILGAIGYGVYHFFFSATSARACDKLASLCNEGANKKALQRCEGFFAQLEEAGGKENIERSRTCILESESCPAAMGCMVGAGLNAAGDFLDGIKRSIEKK